MTDQQTTWCLEYTPLQGENGCYHISERWEYERNIEVCKLRGIENGYTILSEHEGYGEALSAMLQDMEKRGVKCKNEEHV